MNLNKSHLLLKGGFYSDFSVLIMFKKISAFIAILLLTVTSLFAISTVHASDYDNYNDNIDVRGYL